MTVRFLLAALFLVGCPGPSRIEGTEPGDCSDGADNDADGAFDCDDSSCRGAPACDAEVDAGGTDAGGTDAGDANDGGPDAPAPLVTDACVPFASALDAGLGAALGQAVGGCTARSCASCALADGRGASCGPGATMTSCILECIEENDLGECESDGSCSAADADCDVAAGRCRSRALAEVNRALLVGEIDLDCVTCHAEVSDCIVTESCLVSCAGAGCPCDRCQCDVGCPDRFATCSGLPPPLDCAGVPTTCGP